MAGTINGSFWKGAASALLAVAIAAGGWYACHQWRLHHDQASPWAVKARLPDDMRDVAAKATTAFAHQNYPEAEAGYQVIIDHYPTSLYAWSNLGVVCSQAHQLEKARAALQRAVDLSPKDAFSLRNLGIVYYQLKDNATAVRLLQESIKVQPKNTYSHDYLGCALSALGQRAEAEQEFRKAIEVQSGFSEAHYNLAIVLMQEKPPRRTEAQDEYKQALALGLPPDPRMEKMLAR